MLEEKAGCERCKSGLQVNAYQRNLPRKVRLCEGCWKKFIWARAEFSSLWGANNDAFLTGFINKDIPIYPNDPDFKRRLAMRSLYRLREKRVQQRTALTRSFNAREDDLHLAAEVLDEDFESIKKKVLIAEVSPGIAALEGRLQKMLDQDPIYLHYLKNIQAEKCGPGVVVFAGLLSEIGAERAMLCWQHKRGGIIIPKLFHKCEHGAQEDFGEALFGARPNERVYGIRSFPTSSDLRSFFGLGFVETGGTFSSNGSQEEWYVRDRPSSGGELNISRSRKTLAANYLATSIEKRNNPDNPWNQFYLQEKPKKRAEWEQRFAHHPPPKCTACISAKCEKCENHSGNWERPLDPGLAIWVCNCHKNGYWFGSPNHLRMHALGKTASLFLDLLFHTWRYLEGAGDPPAHPLARRYLTN